MGLTQRAGAFTRLEAQAVFLLYGPVEDKSGVVGVEEHIADRVLAELAVLAGAAGPSFGAEEYGGVGIQAVAVIVEHPGDVGVAVQSGRVPVHRQLEGDGLDGVGDKDLGVVAQLTPQVGSFEARAVALAIEVGAIQAVAATEASS